MRWICGTLTGALLAASPLAAQMNASRRAWSVAMTMSFTGFHGAASDTSATGPATIRPSPGIALGFTATRRWNPWALSFSLSRLPTHVEAVSDEVAVEERAVTLERVRIAITAARRIANIGTGALELRAGPTLDHWSADGEDGRTVAGAETTLTLGVPLGQVTMEYLLGIAWSAGPFRADELPTGYERRGLRALAAGAGIRIGL